MSKLDQLRGRLGSELVLRRGIWLVSEVLKTYTSVPEAREAQNKGGHG